MSDPNAAAGVALTFDDGPDPIWTARLLDVLGRAGARATFFPIAPRATAHPDLLRRIRAAGHTVGLHCAEHSRHSERNAEWLRTDTESALTQLRALGVEPELWRTPWGITTAFTHRIADEHGLRLVSWTVDTQDWRGNSAEAMFQATRSALAAGSVVLAHDGSGPGARRLGAVQTVRYVEMVAAHAARQGIRLVALS